MKEYILLVIKGMIIGLANVIPGVSGGTLMITLGIYEQVISTISHFFKNWSRNLKFIVPLGLGMVLALLLFSKIIGFCLEKYPFPTTFLFIGLILGGIPILWRKVKLTSRKMDNWLVFLLTFTIVIVFAFVKAGNYVVDLTNLRFGSCLLLFLVGLLASSTMIIPGISGSFVLMLLGYYQPIINTVRQLTDFSLLTHNLLVLIPFGIGVLVGIVLVAKIIEFLLKKYEVKTYFGVLGFVLASLVAIIKPIMGLDISVLQLFLAVMVLVIGFVASYKLGE